MSVRSILEEREKSLSPYAKRSYETRGRAAPVTPDDIRTEFQRDRDRIIHSKAFRRLMHKTQMFLAPEGDHYRTRLTHTMEVSQIARTISRAVGLNEDLTEAISLGHDLGHAPFGHTGERTLNRLLEGGFRHNEQSRRVVEILEEGRGLNLTWEVVDGIACHSGVQRAETLEGRVVAIADRIAYINHDIDDAVRAGMLRVGQLPRSSLEVLGETHGQRIDTLVRDVIRQSTGQPDIVMSPAVEKAMLDLREFMFDNIYINTINAEEEERAGHLITHLFERFTVRPEEIPPEYTDGSPERRAADYISGMTDRYAIRLYQSLFLPSSYRG